MWGGGGTFCTRTKFQLGILAATGEGEKPFWILRLVKIWYNIRGLRLSELQNERGGVGYAPEYNCEHIGYSRCVRYSYTNSLHFLSS